MKRFDKKTFDEKIKTLKEGEDSIIPRPWNESFASKFIILLPSIIFLLLIISSKIQLPLIDLFIFFITSLVLIFLGILLYFRMIA